MRLDAVRERARGRKRVLRAGAWTLCLLLTAASARTLAHDGGWNGLQQEPGPSAAGLAGSRWARWSPRATGLTYLHGPWKRAFDVVGGGVMAVLSTPIVGGAALAILVEDYVREREQVREGKIAAAPPWYRRKNPFFRQERVTRGGRFKIWKLRTMSDYDGPGDVPLPYESDESEARVTRVGRCLRRCFIAELPQSLNVVFGEMSLVGPRPPQPREVEGWPANVPREWAEPWRRMWTEVRAGVTGRAQVVGHRQPKTYDELQQRMEHDLHYMENASLATDVALLLKTGMRFVHGQGD